MQVYQSRFERFIKFQYIGYFYINVNSKDVMKTYFERVGMSNNGWQRWGMGGKYPCRTSGNFQKFSRNSFTFPNRRKILPANLLPKVFQLFAYMCLNIWHKSAGIGDILNP